MDLNLKHNKEPGREHLKASWTIGKFMQQSKKHGRPRASLWLPAGGKARRGKGEAEAGAELQSVADHVAPASPATACAAERKHGLPRETLPLHIALQTRAFRDVGRPNHNMIHVIIVAFLFFVVAIIA